MASPLIRRPAVDEALEESFADASNPIIVCGPPGAGKTTIVRAHCSSRDWRVLALSLAGSSDAAALPERLAALLGSELDPESVGRALQALGEAVVILDDTDRLAESVGPVVERWRDAAPNVSWVVIGRQRLRIGDWDVVRVGPMEREEAVRLFEARAREVRPSFEFDDGVGPIVEELVDGLDRIPLAVELAAARVNTLGPAELLRRLPQRFKILRGRDRTLRDAIELSWDLLDDDERSVLSQCTVFRGGFMVGAVEAVVELSEDGPWVVDVLEALVRHSLLRSLEPEALAGEVRFDMLSSIREFARAQSPPSDALRCRHARWAASHCRELTWAMRRKGGADARWRLENERENLIAAQEATTDAELSVDLALVCDKLFRLLGASSRWEEILENAVAHAASLGDGQRALVHRALGELHLLRGRFEQASRELEDAAGAAEAAREFVTLGWTHFLRGEVERRRGRPTDAMTHLDRAIEVARAHDVLHVERMALGHRASCLVDRGELEEARATVAAVNRLPASDDLRDEATLRKRVAYVQYYLGNVDEQRRLTCEALELARAAGDRRMEALCIQGLGDAAFASGDWDEAAARWEEGLELHRAHGSVELEGALLGNLGNLHHRRDRLDEARDSYQRALALHTSSGARPYEAVTSFSLAVLEFERGHPEAAAEAAARAAEINADIGNDAEVGSCRLLQAWVATRTGDDPDEHYEAARRAFVEADEPDWVALVDVSRGHDADIEDVEETVALCAAALRGETVADRSLLHVRAALALDPRSDSPEQAGSRLLIARDASWFEVDGTRVDLRRRKAPRHILARLVELREENPSAAIDVFEAFEVGWPGEVATTDAAADRVYWAIRTLRKLGLESFLVTSDEGYLLSARENIEVTE